MTQRVIVGVSGGVDSTVTLLELKDRGYQVRPVYLKMKDSLDRRDEERLSRLEKNTGLTVHVEDVRTLFAQRIIDPFVQALHKGLTPNPCVWCNQNMKLKALFEIADQWGGACVATGHYARKISTPNGERLAKALSSKDQSYMLYRIPVQWIERLIFPLAASEKAEVRQQVRRVLGEDQGEGDSQDICFLESLTLEQFINQKLAPEGGDMVSCEGVKLGRHKGLAHYTPGQRKGLGLSGGPWFVVEKKFTSNQLILDRAPKLCTSLILEDCCWHDLPQGPCQVKTRYRGGETDCQVGIEGSKAMIRLDRPQTVAPGQSAVLYDGDRLLGGGFISLEGDQNELC